MPASLFSLWRSHTQVPDLAVSALIDKTWTASNLENDCQIESKLSRRLGTIENEINGIAPSVHTQGGKPRGRREP